ncbi:MAG: hypothetical protein RJB38_659, partial [Pseudomonadota bacterium]
MEHQRVPFGYQNGPFREQEGALLNRITGAVVCLKIHAFEKS